ncbi:MAG: S1-C subfamily serine protease [Verrucomicrobiales bacterium]|jgi:S1-C subfamily serine protease
MAGLVVACVVVLVACGEDLESAQNGGSSAEPTAPVVRPSVEVVEDSIVRIVGFGCGAPTLGTGFAVAPQLIITNGHIVTGRDPETLTVQQVDGTEYPAILVGFDQDLDLALLRIDEAEFRPVTLITEVPIVDGVAIGIRPVDGENAVNEVEFVVDAPVTVNWDGVFRDTESSYRGLRIDAEIRKGDSGSPLFINDRDVIGLVQSKARRGDPRGYAVGSSEIARFVAGIDPAVEVVAERCT